jgi:hypothetical protein
MPRGLAAPLAIPRLRPPSRGVVDWWRGRGASNPCDGSEHRGGLRAGHLGGRGEEGQRSYPAIPQCEKPIEGACDRPSTTRRLRSDIVCRDRYSY